MIEENVYKSFQDDELIDDKSFQNVDETMNYKYKKEYMNG